MSLALGGEERPLPFDLMPRIIAASELREVLSAGIRQRVKALECFLDDVYEPGSLPRRRRGAAPLGGVERTL